MTHGAVASGDLASARAGTQMLEAGGNAVDAAVAAALMAAFSLPTMTSLGGGGVMTVCVDGKVQVLDHFAAIPGKGFSGTRREAEVIWVPFEGVRQPFRVGRPAMAVPGAVAGLFEVHARHGRVPMRDVAAPAIAAAREGITVTDGQQRAFALLEPIFRRTPGAWALIGKIDHALAAGDTLVNADFAGFLEFLVDEGAPGFYEGEVAARIETASDGFVTTADLAAYRPVWREPLSRSFRGYTVSVPAMPSLSGAVILCALTHLEAEGEAARFGTSEYWGRLARAMQAGAAVRTEDYETRLFEDGYLEGVVSTCPGGSTMQCSVVDDEGNAVSYTTTVGEGSGFVIPGAGVMLNNFLGEDDIFPDHADPTPGARMMTAMSPAIASGPGGDLAAVGAAGSSRIKSAILQVLAHVIDGGLRLEEAVAHPRIHFAGDTVYIETYGRTPEEVEMLKPLGTEAILTYEAGFFFGGAQAAAQRDGAIVGAADEVRRGCAFDVV